MIFPFDPTPAYIDPSWIARPSGFTDEQLDLIVKEGDARIFLTGMEAKVGGPLDISKVVPAARLSTVAWVPADHANTWLYRGLTALVQEANGHHWHVDLAGFQDALQYTTYGLDGHYTWHQDKFPGDRPQRKLGLSLLLTDPADYDGGDLEINDGRIATIPHKERGMVIVFPSYVLHRVTPITRGTRKSLVGWVSGPRWR